VHLEQHVQIKCYHSTLLSHSLPGLTYSMA